MQNFVLSRNQQSNGDYEVHNKTTGCSHMPEHTNQIDLGWHASCTEAVVEAKRRHPTNTRINGCFFCCEPCHTS